MGFSRMSVGYSDMYYLIDVYVYCALWTRRIYGFYGMGPSMDSI